MAVLMGVISVCCDEMVLQGASRLHANRNSLLTVVQVTEAADLALLVHCVGCNLHTADGEHVFVPLDHVVVADCGLSHGRTIAFERVEGSALSWMVVSAPVENDRRAATTAKREEASIV